MRLTNIIQQLTLAVAFTLVSFTVTAQTPTPVLSDDEILLIANESSLAIDTVTMSNSRGILLKLSEADATHYCLYTSKRHTKLKFGEKVKGVSKEIYIDKKDLETSSFFESHSTLDPENIDGRYERTIIDTKTRTIGPNPKDSLSKGKFYFAKEADKTAPVMRLTICRASEFQGAENLKNNTILSVRDSLATREIGDDGIVIALSDKSAIDTLDIKIPANTILREVRVGDSVVESYIPAATTFANEFEKERSKQQGLESDKIDSLLAGKPLTLTYVAFDDNGVLNQNITLTYKFTYTEPAPAPVLLWWHYLVAALVLVAILATIGAVIWRKRVKSKKEREEREEQREKEEKKKKKKHHDDDDKENQAGDENKESTSGDSATKSDDLEELKRKLADAEAKLQELEQVQSDLEASRQRVVELNGTIEAKDREIGRLNGEIERLGEELSTKSRELEQSQSDLEAAQGALETLKSKIDEKVEKAVKEKETAHNAEVKRLNREHQEAIDAKESEITGLNEQHDEAIAEEQAKYKELEERYNAVADNWRRDREQILAFFSSQFKFIDGDIANILDKADPSSPIYQILEQLRNSQYGYEDFKKYINDTLKCEDRAIEELIKDVRAFVMTNMRADMSWINNAARLTAYASTKEFKPVFGHYKDAAKDTKHLFEQIEILLAMWGITNIYIPKLLTTKYNENEHNYSISTLVLPSIFPDYAEHTGNMVIYDFLQVGYMANGEKVKAVIAY